MPGTPTPRIGSPASDMGIEIHQDLFPAPVLPEPDDPDLAPLGIAAGNRDGYPFHLPAAVPIVISSDSEGNP